MVFVAVGGTEVLVAVGGTGVSVWVGGRGVLVSAGDKGVSVGGKGVALAVSSCNTCLEFPLEALTDSRRTRIISIRTKPIMPMRIKRWRMLVPILSILIASKYNRPSRLKHLHYKVASDLMLFTQKLSNNILRE